MTSMFNPNIVKFPGWVYVITIFDSARGYICKVGGTKRDPQTRFSELVHQGSPLQLDLFDSPQLYCAIYVPSVWQVEHIAHQILATHYLDEGSELFHIEPASAVKAISTAIDTYHLLDT